MGGAPRRPLFWAMSPTARCMGDAGEEYNRSCSPGSAFPGISPALPPPEAGGGARSAGGVGGERRAMYGSASWPRPPRALTTISLAPARGPVGRAGMVLFDGEGVPSPAPPPGDAHHGPVHGMTPVKDTIGPAFPGDFTITIPELRGAGWGREENNIQICLPGPSPGRRLPRSGARDDAGEGYTLGPNPPDIPFLRGPGEIGKLCTTLHQGVRKNRHVR